LDSSRGYVYIFQGDGTLPQGANEDYVTYTFSLDSGPYIPNYDLYGSNPEDSEVYSDYYRTHFSNSWIRDELNVYAGAATGVDILDRHRNQFAPNDCGRSEDTFSGGEGAFFANIDGPVRAIRSYMGANSGPFTQRLHLFYESRQDLTTFLRVHEIKGVMDLYDYSPAASGMTYYNNHNVTGVTVDGDPDTVSAGPLAWEMVTGSQGALVISHSLETDIDPLTYTSYYSDDSTPSETQCTGDAYEYGESGDWIDQTIPDTNPTSGSNYLNTTRIIYYEEPGQTVGTTQARHAQAANPLHVSVLPYDSGGTVATLHTLGLIALALALACAAGVCIRRYQTSRTR
jgi:hypothetical protein